MQDTTRTGGVVHTLITALIVVIAMGSAVGGAYYGQKTAPRPWEEERTKLYAERLHTVKRIRAYREILGAKKGPRSTSILKKNPRKAKPSTRAAATTKPAPKR